MPLATGPIGLQTLVVMLTGLILSVLIFIVKGIRHASQQRALETAAASERARDADEKAAEIVRLQAEMTGRIQSMAEIFGARHGDLARTLGERIDSLRTQVGTGLENSTKQTNETMSKLNERLAVIDSAQKNLTDLTGEVISLKDVLSNKQARGAYGQGRMEAIVRDGLPLGAYEFQATLSNNTRPDCVVRLPGDTRALVVDAKFPLEGFSAYRSAQGDEARRQAAARVKTDVGAHIRSIADKYLIPGETQDTALLFVPSEAIYADLYESFDDIVQRAYRARVMVVSPSLLTLAIQVMQSLVRDARVREEALVIQTEVAKLVEDVVRLRDRVDKLDRHFRQAQEDVTQIKTSADKIAKRGERIEALDFETAPSSAPLEEQPSRPRAVLQAVE